MTYQTREKGLRKVSIQFVGGVYLIEYDMEEWLPYCVCTRWSRVSSLTSGHQKTLKNVIFKEFLAHPRVHHTYSLSPRLQGNLATEGVTLLKNNEANSINLSLFLPQQNTSMINKEHSNNLTACSENNKDIADAHKSKANVAITCISTIVDMTNFSSLCINCDTIISTIVDSSGPQPFYRQILLKPNEQSQLRRMVCCQQGKYAIPSLARILFPRAHLQPLRQVPNGLWQHHVMTGLRPLAELNTKPLVKALTVLKAFEDQLTIAQSTNSPIPILAATVSKFSTKSQGTNSNVGTLAPAPVYASVLPEITQNQRRDVKRDPSTPDKSTKAAAIQHQKKPHHNGAIDPAK
jgi:hypothetical protein